MFNFLEKLRQKPDRVKKQIAFLIALFFSGLIFVIWLSVIYPDFKRRQQRTERVSNLEPSPIETFGETFKTGASAIGEQFTQLKESIYSISAGLVIPEATTTPSDVLNSE